MKRLAFILFCIFCIISCRKEHFTDSLNKPATLKNVDFVKSVNSDYVTGKLTIVYESGKKVIKDLPKDTLPHRKTLNGSWPTGSAKALLGAEYEDYIEFSDPMVDYNGDEYAGAAGTILNVQIGCRVLRDQDTKMITGVQGFYGYVVPPISEYIAADGQVATRTASMIGLTGWGAPLPGSPIFISWHGWVNVVYTWSSGPVFTRQYERTGTKMVY